MIPVVLAAAMAEKKDGEPVVTFGPDDWSIFRDWAHVQLVRIGASEN